MSQVLIILGLAAIALIVEKVYWRLRRSRYSPQKLARSSEQKQRTYTVEFNGKTYEVSPRRYDLIQRAQAGNEEAQYEILTEYYETFRSKEFIPELCFFYTKQLAEKDLGVLTELGDLYFDGVGTPKDEEKGRAAYAHAVELYDNPPEGLYVPERSKKYRDFLMKKAGWVETKK